MEANLITMVADHGLAGVALFLLWRLTEKVGSMAEAFASCGAKMDTILTLIGKDQTR